MSAHLLVIDDDAVTRELLTEVLQGEGYEVVACDSGPAALARAAHESFDLTVTDIRMPEMDGITVTRALTASHPDMQVIVMTAFGSVETAVDAVRHGAFDYVSKPMNIDEIKTTVRRALGERHTTERHPQIEEASPDASIVVGRSPVMVEVYKTVARVAASRSTVLVEGESGTGKELIAAALHRHSGRPAKRFVAVDCGALTDTLLESELFGYVRGAFTGAVGEKKGLFEEANGGTIFLDEIGDIGAPMQAKLLRVIVFARFTNGQSSALGKLALANFVNPQGLQQLGDTSWGQSFQSGDALLGEAGTASFGNIQSGALEASNVDLTAQLVQMITAQRNFQANAQMISTADTVTQTVINIR
jgi:DNA-binding NtrC family response regulator